MEYNWNYDEIYKKYVNSHNLIKKNAYTYLLNCENVKQLDTYNIDNIVFLLKKRPISTEIYFSDLLYDITKSHISSEIVLNKKECILLDNELVSYALKFYEYYNNQMYDTLIKGLKQKYINLNIDNSKMSFAGQTIYINNKEVYINIKRTNTVDDVFTLIHEFKHVLDENKYNKLIELRPTYTELYAHDFYDNKFDVSNSKLLFDYVLSETCKKYNAIHIIYKETFLQNKKFIKDYLIDYLYENNISENELYYLLVDAFEYKDFLTSILLAKYLYNNYNINQADNFEIDNKKVNKLLLKHF